MKLSSTTLFVEGEIVPALKVEVTNMYDLRTFSEMANPSYELFSYTKGSVSGEALEALAKEPGILKDFVSTYNHYKLDLQEYCCGEFATDSTILSLENPARKRFTKQEMSAPIEDNPSYSFREMVKSLVQDCQARMPYEFDSQGRDLGWSFLGDRVLLVKGNRSEKSGREMYKGFLTYTLQSDKSLKIWTVFTRKEFRNQQVFGTLLKHINSMAKSLGCTKILIATDNTPMNPMNGMLLKKGFVLESRTYRSGVDQADLKRAEFFS